MPTNYVNAQSVAMEAGISNFSVIQDKSIPGQIDSTKDVNITSSALLPNISNPGAIEGIDDGEILVDQIEIHTVKSGETLQQIADMFGVSVNTILWANDMKKGDKLVVGDTLIILPVDGLKHTIVKGDTLKKLALKYKVEVIDITSYNGILIEDDLEIGQEIIIPDAESTEPSVPKTSVVKKGVSPILKDTKGYFTYPTVSWAKRMRGIQSKPKHSGVDLAAPIGTPIYAAASGKVIVARSSGYNGGYGKMVIISHSNGTQTIYGHLSSVDVGVGQNVSKGQKIGGMGSTGRSTGSHLHFEVKNGKNPF